MMFMMWWMSVCLWWMCISGGWPLVDVHDEDHEMDDVDVVDEWVPLRVHRHDMKPTKRTNIIMN